MVDATVEEEGNNNEGEKFTDLQIVAYSVDFLLAGYETTANALSFTSYLLALHPDIQQRLQSDIDNYFEENPVSMTLIISAKQLIIRSVFYISIFYFLVKQENSLYEASQTIQYLDMTLQESLRLYTPVPK